MDFENDENDENERPDEYIGSNSLVVEVAQECIVYLELEEHENWPASHDYEGIKSLANKVLLGNGTLQPSKLENLVKKKKRAKPLNFDTFEYPYKLMTEYRKASAVKNAKSKHGEILKKGKGALDEIYEHLPWWRQYVQVFKTRAVTLSTSKKMSTNRKK
eukprot:Pgem_evm1s17622